MAAGQNGSGGMAEMRLSSGYSGE